MLLSFYLTLLERASLGEGEEDNSRWCRRSLACVREVRAWSCAAMLEALELTLSRLSASVRLPPTGLREGGGEEGGMGHSLRGNVDVNYCS